MRTHPSQSPGDRPTPIGREAARQLGAAAQRLQRSFPYARDRGMRGDRGEIGLWYPHAFPGLFPATVTAEITACSTSATPVPGTGQAQLWVWDDDAETFSTNGDDGPNEDGIVTVRNWFTASGTIAVGTHVVICPWSNAWWLISGDC